MLIDAQTLPPGAELTADVCIVGAGPAGIALGLELMATDLRVLILESGGLESEGGAKGLSRGSSAGYPYAGLEATRARAFGGTSVRWEMPIPGNEGWMARPLDPIDFDARPEIPHSGWPFGYAQLERYYRRAHAIADLGPDTFEVVDWERPDMRALPLPVDRVETLVFQRGMSSFVRFRDRIAVAAEVTVVHNATVVEVESTGEPPAVSGLVVASTAERRFRVGARLFVLAAGGIENPRLLLTSRGQQPSGLGNGHDLVGRFFMEHPAGRVGFLRPAKASMLAGVRLFDSHREGTIFVQAGLGLHDSVLRSEGLRNAAFFLLPRTEAFAAESVRSIRALAVSVKRRPWAGRTPGHLRNVLGGLAPIAEVAIGRFRRSKVPPRLLAVRIQAEQAPNPASRITLDRSRDRYGIPRPALDWRLTDADVRSMRRSEDLLEAELERIGFGPINQKLGEEDPPIVFEGNHHHMGTTRMHVDPAHGVVDADGRVHGVQNLYIAGSSVFPTGGHVSPTYTVVALAIRLADHVQTTLAVK